MGLWPSPPDSGQEASADLFLEFLDILEIWGVQALLQKQRFQTKHSLFVDILGRSKNNARIRIITLFA